MLETLYIIVMMMLLFSATIFVHEFGHFIVAKKCGLVIETFSIGMGPALWQKEIGGIIYKIGAFPIGGYVALPQLDPDGMRTLQGENGDDTTAEEPLPEISPWKKIAVAFSGAFFNILFALLLAGIVYLAPQKGITEEDGVFIASVDPTSAAYTAGIRAGDEIRSLNGNPVKSWYQTRVEALLGSSENHRVRATVFNPTDGERTVEINVNPPDVSPVLIQGVAQAVTYRVSQVLPDSPAERAGLRKNDIIHAIGDLALTNSSHFSEVVRAYPDEEIVLKIRRDTIPMEIPITPTLNEEHDSVMVGIVFGGTLSLPWTLSGNPIEQISTDATSIFRLLRALVTPTEAKQAAGGIGGPVSIFTMIWMALKMGLVNALGLIRFININLAILNLLPIPVLDGGHICFSLWEGITKRKVHPKVVMTLINLFAVLLIGAMLVLTWRDIDRNWNVGRFFKKPPAEAAAPAP